MWRAGWSGTYHRLLQTPFRPPFRPPSRPRSKDEIPGGQGDLAEQPDGAVHLPVPANPGSHREDGPVQLDHRPARLEAVAQLGLAGAAEGCLADEDPRRVMALGKVELRDIQPVLPLLEIHDAVLADADKPRKPRPTDLGPKKEQIRAGTAGQPVRAKGAGEDVVTQAAQQHV